MEGVSIMWLLIIDRWMCCTNWDYWPWEKENTNNDLIWAGVGYLLMWNFWNGQSTFFNEKKTLCKVFLKSRCMRKYQDLKGSCHEWRIYSSWIFISLNFCNVGKANIRHNQNLSARAFNVFGGFYAPKMHESHISFW